MVTRCRPSSILSLMRCVLCHPHFIDDKTRPNTLSKVRQSCASNHQTHDLTDPDELLYPLLHLLTQNLTHPQAGAGVLNTSNWLAQAFCPVWGPEGLGFPEADVQSLLGQEAAAPPSPLVLSVTPPPPHTPLLPLLALAFPPTLAENWDGSPSQCLMKWTGGATLERRWLH